ncbi:MAG: DUF5681 domain-containing protein [Rhodospirillaceae bacterium]
MVKKRNDYEVGYKKPPKHTRFKPGDSGNPSGRPRKARSSNELLEQVLNEKVTITIRGRQRTVTMKEVLIRQLITDGMKGNQRALKAIFNRETERILDEDARQAERRKYDEEFKRDLDQIRERIRQRQAKEAAAKQGIPESGANNHEPLMDEKKAYDPEA